MKSKSDFPSLNEKRPEGLKPGGRPYKVMVVENSDFQRKLISELEKRGIRDKYKVIVGGSPTSDEWAEEIGADGWADDAIEAVSLVNKILNS